MHTPGPWTVEEYGDEDCPALVIHRDSENRICFMATPGSHGDPAQIVADARLIAKAPDLLLALTKISNEVRGFLSAYEHELRPIVGNTNFAVLELREKEARTLLSEV